MKKYNKDPFMEKALSEEYYKLRSSRDFYTGTSFKMSTWDLNTRYFNDENIIDFVSYKGCLLYCTRSHISSESNEPVPIIENDIIVGIHPNIFWKFVMGTNGKGVKGDKGDAGPKGEPGVTGDPGPAGKDGVDGLPGIGIEVRYCLGTTTIYGGTSTPGTTRQPTGWNLAVPTPTEETPYIWFIQARVNYTSNTDKVGTIEGSWSTPTKLSGTNGLNGENGSKGQIIYPEGIYNVNTVYQGTVDKTPYVYDSNDANYYVLNIVGTWQGTLHSNESPSTDTSNSWVKLEAFEALYAKIGIIPNALIGSAVFNDAYMFSQQGVDENGEISTHYENFNPITPGEPANSTNPEKPGIRTFIPNIMFNFETGTGHMSTGNISFDSDGNIYAKNISVNGNMSGSDEDVLDLTYSSTTQTVTLTGLKNITVYMNESNITKSKVQLLNIDASVFDNMSSKSKYTIDIFNNGNIPLLFDSTGFYRPGFDMLESYSYVAVLPRQSITLKI